jgi:hypothetical protein
MKMADPREFVFDEKFQSAIGNWQWLTEIDDCQFALVEWRLNE